MESPQTSAPESWEYMVIHLNIEPGPAAAAPGAAKPAEGGGGEEGGPAKPVFSDSFLKKEFPQFYENRPAQERPAQQPQHPAQQLQNFLNGHGAQGWELIGVFPVGALTMLFFRRRRIAPPAPVASPQSAPAAAQPPAEAAQQSSGSTTPPPPGPGAPDRDGVLEAVLARLTALEQGMASSGAEAPSRSRRRPSSGDQGAPLSGAPAISASQLKRLGDATPLPSSAAAQAIGLRSAASLANHGARHGFRQGLCKIGPNGMAAIYVGQGKPERGGLARRLWIVVAAERLQD